ncbi:MAG: UDP-N-acetylmuramate--L-alanine ligase [Myxococcota bacterium]
MIGSIYRRRLKRIHFVGIGGIGMSGIAEVLLNQGYTISGSDVKESDTTRRLGGMGARIRIGHAAENVVGPDGQADVVVISTAVRETNPEVKEAQSRGIPVIPRAEMLAELMRMKYGIAVAGMHGKTSTTSLVANLLGVAGMDPTVIIGGKVNQLGSNAKLGQGPFLVAEADESDGSFLRLTPTICVVTNIDREHLDFWKGGLAHIQSGFVEFVNRLPFYGLAILCLDNPHVQAIIPRVVRRHVTYGLSAQADYRAVKVQLEGMRSRFELVRRGERLGEITLNMIGMHNVTNALSVCALADELEIPFPTLVQAMAGFQGVQRRFTIRGEAAGITVVDDYGHHPAEIQATLAGARGAFPDRRIVVLFQPHRYTRTRDLMEEFAVSFNDADVVINTDIYAASEDPIEGISGKSLHEAIRRHGHHDSRYAARAELVSAAMEVVKPGDIVITQGAGDITNVGEELLGRISASSGHA